MKNKKLFPIFSLILGQFLLSSLAYAQVLPTPTPTSTSSTSTTTLLTLDAPIRGSVLGAQIPPLISEIRQAKNQLTNVDLKYNLAPVYKNVKNRKTGKITKTLSSYSLTGKDIALAILDPFSNNIITTVGTQSGKSMTFKDPVVDVSLKSFNGVNSKFTVNTPAGGTVLALKYLITGPEQGSKASIINAMSQSVYVPYSAGLNQPNVIAYGENYLNNILDRVSQDLQDTPSSAIPGQSITKAIRPALVKALVYAEHTDTTQALNGQGQDAINQLNILFAVNEGDAYKYSVSTAGARGIAQFIPSTYKALVERHPAAGLVPDFVTAMADHENSIKAMYLLIDDYTGDVRIKSGDYFTPGLAFDYGAASYNGGVTRVTKAVQQFGAAWNQDHSADINSLQASVNSLTSQVKNLKAKIKKAADKKAKTSLQSQLTSANSQLSSASGQLTTLKSASLRNETVNYLNKIYSVIRVFNDEQI